MVATIDRTRPEPIYRQIREWMRQQIASGLWPEHYKLKPETELIEDLGVSRGTLRKAIADLTAEGFLVAIHGRGTFVSSSTLEQPLANGLVAFSEDLARQGVPFETEVLEQQIAHPPQRIAALMSVSTETQVLTLKRRRIVHHEPIALLHNYVLIDRAPDIAATDFVHQGLFVTLEQNYHLSLSWGQRTFQAQVADADVSHQLKIEPGAPVMYIEQVTYLSDGTPIELSDIWLRGDRFRLSAVVKRGVQDESGPSTELL